MKSRLLLLFLAVAGLGACGDPTGIRASQPTVENAFSVYALTGTSIALPSAVNLFFARPVRIDPANAYDVVFDIIDGQPVMLPPSQVGAFGNAALQKVNVAYDALTEAPPRGYNDREPVEISEGDVVVVRTQIPQICFGAFTPYIYAKFEILAIDMDVRSFSVRMRVNPNCGFRSFAEGIPRF